MQQYKSQELGSKYDPQFLYSELYSEPDVASGMNSQDYFSTVKYLVENLAIDDKFYQTVQKLITHFKFPIFLCLKKPIQKIHNTPDLLVKHQNDLKKIAKMAYVIIGSENAIQEFNYLFKKGTDKSFYHKIVISQQKKDFIQYIKKLSGMKKNLYQKLQDQSITQEDLIQFQGMTYKLDLKNFQSQIQSYIKLCCTQISSKLAVLKKPSNPQVIQQALQEIPICCRRFLYQNQPIYQPQSLHTIYKRFAQTFTKQDYIQILKSICGLLNAQGGNIIIGIFQDKKTLKKTVTGYTLIQRVKQELIDYLSQQVDFCIMPNIMAHDMLKIRYIPVKDYKTKTYIQGKYVLKITVRYGERKEVYCYKQFADSDYQIFAFRTENDTKQFTSSQQILKIYKERLLNPMPPPIPVHPNPCPKPQNGKPLYENNQFGKNN